MLELLREHPWLVVGSLALLIPIFGVVFGTVTGYLTRVRLAEMETRLKQDMLQRGMSAEEIRTVIEATAQRPRKHCKHEAAVHQEVA